MSVGASIGLQFIDSGMKLFGQGVGYETQKYLANKEAKRQDWWGTHGIRAKVRDAKAAGIHPLAALGATTYNPSPTWGAIDVPDFGSTFGQMGQGISNAIGKYATAEGKQKMELAAESAKEAVVAQKLDNIGKAQEIMDARNQTIIGSSAIEQGYNIPGQSNAPDGVPSGAPGTALTPNPVAYQEKPGIATGHNPKYQFIDLPNGNKSMMLSQQVGELIENDPMAAVSHSIGTSLDYIKQALSKRVPILESRLELLRVRPEPLAPGYEWRYNRANRQWVHVPKGKTSQIYTNEKISAFPPGYRKR